jgi:hypothetical protein
MINLWREKSMFSFPLCSILPTGINNGEWMDISKGGGK